MRIFTFAFLLLTQMGPCYMCCLATSVFFFYFTVYCIDFIEQKCCYFLANSSCICVQKFFNYKQFVNELSFIFVDSHKYILQVKFLELELLGERKCKFKFWLLLPNDYKSSYTNLYSHQQWMTVCFPHSIIKLSNHGHCHLIVLIGF